jgi:hypothetical protein
MLAVPRSLARRCVNKLIEALQTSRPPRTSKPWLWGTGSLNCRLCLFERTKLQGRSTHVVFYWGGRDAPRDKAEVPRGEEQVWRNYGDCPRRVMLLVSPLAFVDARKWGMMCMMQATGRRRQVPVDLCRIPDAGELIRFAMEIQ